MQRPEDHRFVPVTRADYPRLRRWLAQPHVAAVWGPVEHEIELIEAEIDGGDCAMHIVEAGGRPIGYVQDWCPHRAGARHLSDAPAGARVVDTFLGEPALLGRGYASAWMRAYARRLRGCGASAVLTDPHVDNPRAVAMYRAAGFRTLGPRRAADGAEVLAMQFAGG